MVLNYCTEISNDDNASKLDLQTVIRTAGNTMKNGKVKTTSLSQKIINSSLQCEGNFLYTFWQWFLPAHL